MNPETNQNRQPIQTVKVDVTTPALPLPPFWAATGYANADFTYTPAFGRMYDYLSSYARHMKYIHITLNSDCWKRVRCTSFREYLHGTQ